MVMLILGGAALGGALVGWGNRRRASAHQQVLRRSAELDSAASSAVQGERVMVARDLHDVVSHAVAVMVMQAGAAETLLPGDPERARAALAVVRQTAAETLGELNRLVAAIGAGDMGAALPAAGAVEHDADDLAALVHRMSGAGLRISLVLDGRPSGTCGAVVYRIVQEALTNAVRHAPGARVTVTVRVRDDETTVEVVDDGPGSAAGSRRGYGLVGIAERVERAGGHLITGPVSPGTGFRVSARLPAAGPVPA
jgi:signal transduction histidine kinase